MWQNSHFAKARVRQNGLVFAFTFYFLKLRFCKRNETRLLCLRLQSIRFCVINVVTKCLIKLQDYHKYQRQRLFSVLGHDLEGCNKSLFLGTKLRILGHQFYAQKRSK